VEFVISEQRRLLANRVARLAVPFLRIAKHIKPANLVRDS
jgi:hypothetical protein